MKLPRVTQQPVAEPGPDHASDLPFPALMHAPKDNFLSWHVTSHVSRLSLSLPGKCSRSGPGAAQHHARAPHCSTQTGSVSAADNTHFWDKFSPRRSPRGHSLGDRFVRSRCLKGSPRGQEGSTTPLSSTAATSHMWLLSTGNGVLEPKGLNF